MILNRVDHITTKPQMVRFKITIVLCDASQAEFHQLYISASALCGQPVQVSFWLIVTTGGPVRQKPNKPQLHH